MRVETGHIQDKHYRIRRPLFQNGNDKEQTPGLGEEEKKTERALKIMVIVKAVFGVHIPQLGVWEESLHLWGEIPLRLHQSLIPCSL